MEDYEPTQQMLFSRRNEAFQAALDGVPISNDENFMGLDIGAGQGALTQYFLNKYQNSKWTLYDQSTNMLNVARSNLLDYGKQVTFIKGDFNHDNKFQSLEQKFDVICAAFCIHFVPRKKY